MQNSHKWLSRFRLKSNTWVYVPTSETVTEGTLYKKLIALKWQPPTNYYHLKDGGHVEALKLHLGGKFFIRADLKRFFNSINRSRITRELKPYFGYETARKMAMDSTVSIPHEDGQVFALPFGFVQSTIIASLCLDKSTLGKAIRYLNRSEQTKVCVYVDDIIISTQSMEAAEQALALLKQSSEKSGLLLNTQKLEGPALDITAFNINLSENSIFITAPRIEELKNNYKNSAREKQREGIRSYIYSVNPSQALDLDY